MFPATLAVRNREGMGVSVSAWGSPYLLLVLPDVNIFEIGMNYYLNIGDTIKKGVILTMLAPTSCRFAMEFGDRLRSVLDARDPGETRPSGETEIRLPRRRSMYEGLVDYRLEGQSATPHTKVLVVSVCVLCRLLSHEKPLHYLLSTFNNMRSD